MPVSPKLPERRICSKCHMLLGSAETPFKVDGRTIDSATERALKTESDDALLRFVELAELGRKGGLHEACARTIANILGEKCAPDVKLSDLALATAKTLLHSAT